MELQIESPGRIQDGIFEGTPGESLLIELQEGLLVESHELFLRNFFKKL